MTKYLLLLAAVLLIAVSSALAVAHQMGTIGFGCMSMMDHMLSGPGQPPNQQWPQPR